MQATTISPMAGRPVILVGMMGAGKTTVGRQLARLLGRRFVDLDHELEARCGVPVATIFDIEGEDGFRRREALVLAECLQEPNIVLATGGGAVLLPENRQALATGGWVIYLRATAAELYRRVARDRSRPLLRTDDPQGRLTELLTQRTPLYEAVADQVYDTGGMAALPAAQALANMLQPSACTRDA